MSCSFQFNSKDARLSQQGKRGNILRISSVWYIHRWCVACNVPACTKRRGTSGQDIEHDLDTQAEDWYIAMEALCEVLPSLQPAIVYFPDSSQWLSRAVPKSNRKEFVHKVEEMFDHLSGPVVFICGQNKAENGSKEKEKLTMVLPHFGRIGRLKGMFTPHFLDYIVAVSYRPKRKRQRKGILLACRNR